MANFRTAMCLSRDSVASDPKTTAALGPVGPNTSKRAEHRRDTLVALQQVIRNMSLQRSLAENDIILQRAVLDNQIARLSTLDNSIQELQNVWENMAAGFGLDSKK
ncbi:uncharacterized protein N7479_002912 [Penicillium vulpinum]|uniref:Uncharacterized protein n=1 Tax=Penicillium vulpinum TaxID=29845 RepID=A0A1V6RT32_9EURO|nr:uncharacterized protein N7479_002912 [Penicillium vulpinum]KAJ5972994.1 hypothetical protein N7479_002912 [Penicillium vulpinum]OQE04738.1 hypothetical protein PENVUL_c030G09623 [Penicillium vulpinum]